MQFGNENLSYNGTSKNGEEEWFASDEGDRAACTGIGICMVEEEDGLWQELGLHV